MGEVVVISEGRNKNTKSDGGAAAASSTVMWERFLPKMVVRVLLVESDVSTRQIITTFLRKCSYKVAAVSDGLKAWELLKGRPHNIDLILTEVELPSISGYALLSLIMEHDVCKNIPVIMMSSNHSVSTVYKCMLRGAADFLVKPLGKNELRNMWQHVWRKQVSSSGAGLGPPDESETQQNVKATAENNLVSNRSRECIEKRSDAHSSCSKSDRENGVTVNEHVRCLSQSNNTKCLSNDVNIRAQESKTPIAQDDESDARRDANCVVTRGEENNLEGGLEQVNVNGKQSEINRILVPSREAIDFIGTFDNYLKGTFRSSTSNASTNKLDIFPTLDLSLRRSLPSGFVNLINDERHPLNHSDVSAFSRYINKPLQVSNVSSPSTSNHQKDHETNSKKQFSNHTPDFNTDTHCPASSLHKYVSVTTIQPAPCAITYTYPQQREISIPIPFRGIRFENMINNSYGVGSIVPPIYPTQSVERQYSSYQQCHNLTDQRMSNDVDHQVDNKEKLEHLEDREHVSPGNDQSGNSSLCTGNISHHQIIGLGSVVKVTSECGNEEAREGFSNRSMQREAALTKFRLKRKDRCFDKKVRYESRKKLAEQRPRVKGKFVRQVTNDPQSGNSSAS